MIFRLLDVIQEKGVYSFDTAVDEFVGQANRSGTRMWALKELTQNYELETDIAAIALRPGDGHCNGLRDTMEH